MCSGRMKPASVMTPLIVGVAVEGGADVEQSSLWQISRGKGGVEGEAGCGWSETELGQGSHVVVQS